jgi:glutathione S-transferase
MIELTALPFSPWSEKARWALDHHRIDYRYNEYIPILGELKLRIAMRRPSGLVTVPVLHDGAAWLTDSFEIARYADRVGRGPRLFPGDKLAEVAEWNRRSEAALAAGRALAVLASAADPDMALAVLPPGVPSALKPLLSPIARKGMEIFIAKHRMREGAGSHAAVLERELDALSSALSGRRYLLGDTLSYADIAMAVVLQVVSPVDARYMPKLPGIRALPGELEHRYADLIAWRDQLYAQHRRPDATEATETKS